MTSPRTWLASPILPPAVLLILAAISFARLIDDPSALIVDPDRTSIDYANRGDPRPVGNDLTFLFLPHHESIARRIEAFGHLPTWDARGFGGRPLVGNPQAGMSYPPTWLAWRLRSPSALGWITIAHLLWGGWGTYLLLRSMGAGRWASTVAAGVYQASPYLLAHTFEGHYPHVWAACWYPWAFWAFRGSRERKPRGLLLPPILTLTFLTGHPQEWLLLVLALSGWAVADAILTRRSGGPRGALTWFAALVVSIGMAGIDIGPQLLARPWLLRGHLPGSDSIPRRYHIGSLSLFQCLDPEALGGPSDYFGDDNYWESVCSIGLVPMTLAIVGAFRFPDRRLVRGWLLLLLIAVVFAGGRPMGLYPLACSTIPGVGLIRVAARSLFLANLAAAVLVGLGLETWRREFASATDWRRLGRRIGTAGTLVIVLLVALSFERPTHRPTLSSANIDRPPSPPSGRASLAAARVLGDPRFWAASSVLGLLIAVGCRPIAVRRRRTVAASIGLLALAELAAYGSSMLRVAPASRFVGPDPIGETIARLSGASDRPRPAVRIKARDAFYGDLPATRSGIEKTNIGDTFQIDHASILYETLYPIASHVRPMSERRLSPEARAAWRRIRRAVLDRMGVAFLVSDRVEADPPWPVAAEGTSNGSRFVIQRNPSAMPGAYVVPGATVLPDQPGVVLPALAELDPRRTVVMPSDPMAGLPPGPRQPFAEASWISTDPDRPTFRVDTEAPGLLVITSTWMPGWSATIDGQPAPVLRGDLAHRVVPLPIPGRHVVAIRYRPPGLAAGLALSIVSTLLWLGVAVARWRIQTTAPSPFPPAFHRAQIAPKRHPICQ